MCVHRFAGVIKACLRKDDFISSTYRDHVHALSKGVSARKVMAELFGKKTGVSRGQGGSMHMFDREHGLVGLVSGGGDAVLCCAASCGSARSSHVLPGPAASPMHCSLAQLSLIYLQLTPLFHPLHTTSHPPEITHN
jgi:hypothetical protein